MKTNLRTDIIVSNICESFVYNELEGNGSFGLGGKLTIQPEYQRNYIYSDGRGKKEQAVIESLSRLLSSPTLTSTTRRTSST